MSLAKNGLNKALKLLLLIRFAPYVVTMSITCAH